MGKQEARSSTPRRIAPAVGLFFLSPLVAEFLLGNIAIDAIWIGVFVAPLYGGGAVLIREVARRGGRGWPTMLLLALGFGMIEEGLVTQSLFNPSYFGFDLLSAAYIPVLGVGAWWTVYVLTLHTVWSMAVPIALVEALVPHRPVTPWLGRAGVAVAGLLFFSGAVFTYSTTADQERFLASTPQRIGTAVVVLTLIVAAFAGGKRPRPESAHGVPNPWLVGAASFTISSLFTLGMYLPGWLTVGAWCALFAGVSVAVATWSGRPRWGATHRVALAGGALLTYAWQCFPHTPIVGTPATVDLIGNSVFAFLAILLLGSAVAIQGRVKEK